MTSPSRSFALIPAAGYSTRMGQPKLLLPLAGKPLITHTIDAWLSSNVDRVLVVIRPGDDDLGAAVREAAGSQVSRSKNRVELVVPNAPPPDMKASLQAALAHLQQHVQPTLADAFLVAPADMPGLSSTIINRLIEQHHRGSKYEILAPTISQQRGHPVLFPWRFAAQVFQLGEHEGLNAIVERELVELIACDDLAAADESPFADIDTPEQYNQIIRNSLPNNTN
ncbi:MAG TPA: nucleotidyltransferase family protein [Pirellulaceae bacterium]|jgi:molybdenum cofactor cytidylyltransferase